jgi:hypothetical protein
MLHTPPPPPCQLELASLGILMTKTEELLRNQALKKGLGYVENAIHHRHLLASLPLRGLLFLGQENAGSNA